MAEHELLNALFDRLFPICRSIAGPGFRQSLEIIREHIPLDVFFVPTGTQVFDWTIPPEWHIHDATLIGPDRTVYADFKKTNLAVVNYSIPIKKYLSLSELKPHLHTIPELPDAIPYVTSYYHRNWGFCLPHRVFERLPEGEYYAFIDSELKDGFLNYGECLLRGETDREVLLSSYLCHPSLANNELSGPLVLVLLFKRILNWERRRYSYRFVLNPETIGSIAYLHEHGSHLKERLQAGLVLTCLGGSASLSYKMTRRETHLLDRTVVDMKERGQLDVTIRPFTPLSGSDERQYCSPGFNLPVGQMARALYHEYSGYHNSLDTKEFMGIETLVRSADEVEKVLRTLEYSGVFYNQYPYGEVQLSRRGLYRDMNSPRTRAFLNVTPEERKFLNRARMILCYSDGNNTMLDIAQRCGCAVSDLVPVIDRLEEEKLLTFMG